MVANPSPAPALPTPNASDSWLAIAGCAPLPMAMLEGADHVVCEVNPAFCVLLGKPRVELVGKPIADHVPENDESLAVLARVYRTGKSEGLTTSGLTQPRPYFWAYSAWPVMVDESPVGVVLQVTETSKFHDLAVAMNEALVLGSVRQHQLTEEAETANAQLLLEIAERKQAEAALRVSEERYHSLFDSMDEGFCVIEVLFESSGVATNYRFWETNPAFEKQSGLHDARGKRVTDLVPGIEKRWFKLYGDIVLTGEPVRLEDESPSLGRWFEIHAFRIGDPEGGRVAVLFNDITVRKRSEVALLLMQSQLRDHAEKLEGLVAQRTAELTATNSQLEAFVYSIAHDLRAPLRSMQGFSALLVEEAGTALSTSGRDFASRIDKSAQFMDALLGDLLAFSRISQRQVELMAVNLRTVVESVVSRLQNDIQEKGARVEISGTWPSVLAHEPTLAQVVFNLTSNALKFVEPGVPAHVRMRTEEKGGCIRVWVEDNGVGIAPEHQGQIFRLFARLHGEKFPGTGLGLVIVQKGVERMGGRVGVESTPGHGSRFWFELREA